MSREGTGFLSSVHLLSIGVYAVVSVHILACRSYSRWRAGQWILTQASQFLCQPERCN